MDRNDCGEYLELISANLDGALSPEELERLNAHLARCPECRALMDDLTALHQGLSALPGAQAPAGLTDRVMAAVAADNAVPMAPKKKSPSWRRWGAWAAAFALVFAGAWGAKDRILLGGGSSAGTAPKAAEAALPAEAALEAPAEAEAAAESAEDGDRLTAYAVTGAGRAADSGLTAKRGTVTAGAEEYVQDKAAAQNGSEFLATGEAPALRGPETVEEAAWVLAGYIHELVETVEPDPEDPGAFTITSAAGASGTARCTGEDELIYSFTYEDGTGAGLFRYSVVKSDGSVTCLGREEPESAPAGN